ncbi:chemotaxis protein CheW [Granulicella sibirica]|uniref:Positive regulator of CheA protein activity (CheW) n=1 Tax=Granulicella sibirica TaxID=2479048 RepID=A0A4Q0SVA0_9BACT|nr:chemotaxis protein CheW [Granulicella sibirica]RXH54993.1 Positive regulator of CheA protein activity (CheW) [Granulicella sibirica]
MNGEEPETPEEVSLFSISIGEDLFAIETAKVREVVEHPQMRRVPLAPSHIVGVMPYRGEILSAVSFRALLGYSETRPTGCIIVLEDEQTCELWGLSVDAARGVLTAQTSTLQPNRDARNGLFDGTYETSSGPIIRLDPNRLKPASRGDSPCAH